MPLPRAAKGRLNELTRWSFSRVTKKARRQRQTSRVSVRSRLGQRDGEVSTMASPFAASGGSRASRTMMGNLRPTPHFGLLHCAVPLFLLGFDGSCQR